MRFRMGPVQSTSSVVFFGSAMVGDCAMAQGRVSELRIPRSTPCTMAAAYQIIDDDVSLFSLLVLVLIPCGRPGAATETAARVQV